MFSKSSSSLSLLHSSLLLSSSRTPPLFALHHHHHHYSYRPTSSSSSLLRQPHSELQSRLERKKATNRLATTTVAFADDDDVRTEEENINSSTDDALLASNNTAAVTDSHYYYASQNQRELKSDLARMQREIDDLSKKQNDDDQDDLFVIENPLAPGGKEKIIDKSQLKRDMSGNINHIPKDAVNFVADEFKRLRDLEIIRRRKILADLASPNPLDYSYNGKLVPVPPLNFGKLAPQSFDLADKMLVRPTFRKVREAPATDYFFEINDLYCEISFIGRANSGKSSLINAILGQQGLAKTSSLPHSTRNITFYQSVSEEEMKEFQRKTNPNKLVKLPGGGLQFTLVDVPGFGLDGMSDKWRDNAIHLTDSYFGQRRSINTVFMCIDAKLGVTPTDMTYFKWMTNVHGTFWILLTKCDSVPHARVCTVMNHIYTLITEHQKDDKYRKIYPFVLPVSAKTGDNVDLLRALIVETSGVMPADTLRKLLQQQKGSKWIEAVREEEERLLEEEQERKRALLATRQELLMQKQQQQHQLHPKSKLLLLESDMNNNNNNINANSINHHQQEEETDYGIYFNDQDERRYFLGKYQQQQEQQQQQQRGTISNADAGENDQVLSFEAPNAVSFSDGDGDTTTSGKNLLQKIKSNKMTMNPTTHFPAIFMDENNDNNNNIQNKNSKNQSSSTESFMSELAEKLMKRNDNNNNNNNSHLVGQDNNNNNNNNNSGDMTTADFNHMKSRGNKMKRKKGSSSSSFIVESNDGSLTDYFESDHYQSQRKSRSRLKYEKRQKKLLEAKQQSEVWAKYSDTEDDHQEGEEAKVDSNNRNRNRNNNDVNDVESRAAALRELKEMSSSGLATTSDEVANNNNNKRRRGKSSSSSSSPPLLSKMTKKEREAYMLKCGGTLVSGEALVHHTHQQMAVGEQRNAKTMRMAKSLEFQHSGRLALKSQPGGLWNAYGSANTGKVNSRDVSGTKHSIDRRVLGWLTS